MKNLQELEYEVLNNAELENITGGFIVSASVILVGAIVKGTAKTATANAIGNVLMAGGGTVLAGQVRSAVSGG